MKLIISKSNIQKQGRIELTTGMIGKTVDIEFAPDWNGYTKVAVFRNFIDGETPIIKENPATPLEIPPEVLRRENARCHVGFYGYKIEGGIKTEATPTVYTDLAIVQLGTTTDGNPSMDIPPSVAEQLINDVNVLNNRVDDAEDNIDDLAERMQDAESELADHEERIDALEQGGGGGIPDAPADGKQYARQDHEWTEVAGGGGGTSDHRQLSHRDAANQHPMSAITGLEAALSGKQDTISDLATIRSGAALGATAVQPEAGKGLFSGNYNDLSNKPTIPTVPQNVSAFTNDSGYLTLATLPIYDGSVV